MSRQRRLQRDLKSKGLAMPKTCATCKHWQQQPRDPMNLAAPRVGLCMANPPQFQLLPMPQGFAPVWGYPVLPENFTACALHRPAGANGQPEEFENLIDPGTLERETGPDGRSLLLIEG